MKAERDNRATLVDLLDRVLEKGVVINADLIITLAGIPLLGVQLRALIAGIETMLDYGIWEEWDAALRIAATRDYERKNRYRQPPLAEGETIISEAAGSYRYTDGIYDSWRAGNLSLTTGRIILYRRDPYEVVFEKMYTEIRKIGSAIRENKGGERILHIDLDLNDGTNAQLISSDLTLDLSSICCGDGDNTDRTGGLMASTR